MAGGAWRSYQPAASVCACGRHWKCLFCRVGWGQLDCWSLQAQATGGVEGVIGGGRGLHGALPGSPKSPTTAYRHFPLHMHQPCKPKTLGLVLDPAQPWACTPRRPCQRWQCRAQLRLLKSGSLGCPRVRPAHLGLGPRAVHMVLLLPRCDAFK